MAYSVLEPALSSTLDHRSDALLSALLRRYGVLDLTYYLVAKYSQLINVTLGCALHVSYYFYLNRKHMYR